MSQKGDKKGRKPTQPYPWSLRAEPLSPHRTQKEQARGADSESKPSSIYSSFLLAACLDK